MTAEYKTRHNTIRIRNSTDEKPNTIANEKK